ncbi:hypothetical protein DI005_02125 [Prauserella sp. PE36]|uniref:pentapeptide repeat-containing protein n=1 Tax=Prauserella sp. PE36 TaxID=1504709 RepID=UPI000DE508BE|nr:pentapeptide repeat-containing protein [Prauserella sp. PE36]RBM23763.1 hypothetical protein DI005_02125 [Prauserella sp. PE36]
MSGIFTWDVLRFVVVGALIVAALMIIRVGARRGRWSRPWAVLFALARVLERLSKLVPSGIAASVLGWLLVAVLVASGTAAGLLWLLGWPRFPAASEFGVAQTLELLKIALAVVAGFGGVVLLALNLRKQRVAEAQHDLEVERGDREQTQAFNERFGSAAEQLAHENAAVRIAGIYAMAGLADDWTDQRQVCVDVLCGYLRLAEDENAESEREVRDTVLRVIRDRLARWGGVALDFTGVTFVDADFSGLTFSGDVTFDRASFTGALTSFEKTTFNGLLSCHGTTFSSERTSFRSAYFGKARAEFVGVEFGGKVIDFWRMELHGQCIDFYRTRFDQQQLDFSGALVKAGTLRFDRCEFADSRLDLSLDYEFEDFGGTFGLNQTSMGQVVVEGCGFERCSVELRDLHWAPSYLWLIDTRFEACELGLPAGPTERLRPWLNAREVELVDTDLPEAHVRRRHPDAAAHP